MGTRLQGSGAPWTPEAFDTEAKSIIVTSFGTISDSYKDWEQRGKTKSSWLPIVMWDNSVTDLPGRVLWGQVGKKREEAFQESPGFTHGDTYYGAVDGV